MRRKRKHSLTTLLRLRRRNEDALRQELAVRRAEELAVRSRIDRLQSALAETNAGLRQTLVGGDGPAGMDACRRRLAGIRGELSTQSTRLAETRNELAVSRRRLAEAVRQRKALQCARRRVAADEAAEEWRRDQKETDEIHASRQAMGLAGPAERQLHLA